MRAFVTGATGFVGLNLCERLRRDGWSVRALARSPKKAEPLEKLGCEVVYGGLDDRRFLMDQVREVDTIFHLAGVTKAISREQFEWVNVEATKNLNIAADDGGFRNGRFILLSSLAAAGPAIDGRPRTEQDEDVPVSHYGESKRMGEVYTEKNEDYHAVILRPGAIYGPHEHEMFQIIKQISSTGFAPMTGPDLRIQMTHVDDVVEGLIAAATAPNLWSGTYFLNDQQAWHMSEVLRLIGEVLGKDVRVLRVPLALGRALAWGIDQGSLLAKRPLAPFNGDKMRELLAGDWLADSSRFTEATGWRAKWALPEGMAQTIEWYRKAGWL